jgi:hypothetical protein
MKPTLSLNKQISFWAVQDKGNTLSPQLLNTALEYAIRAIQKKKKPGETNWMGNIKWSMLMMLIQWAET